MPTNLQLFIQGFNDQEKAIADFKERVKQLSIKSGPLKMFIDAYIQDENADVSVAANMNQPLLMRVPILAATETSAFSS